MPSTLPPATTTTGNGIIAFLNNHIWIPIIGSIVLLIIAIVVSYCLCKYRRRRHYYYSPLEEDLAQSTLIQREKNLQKVAMRDAALLNCSFFLRSSGNYSMIDQLPEIGCREEKQWFLVKHREKTREFVLSVISKGRDMALPFGTSTERNLNELFITLDHPYIYPIGEVAFQYDMEQLITVCLYNRKGSIKDYLYSSHCLDDWDVKYSLTGRPLRMPLGSLKLYGRQILEGLMFLKSKGFPYFGHLHSGNVILEDRVCRLSGYENTLFSVKPKLMQLLKKYTETDMRHFDVLSFGHVLYEMATGQELDTAIPESRHYLAIKHTELLEVLQFIFNVQIGDYPSIKKISKHVFFKDVRLSELVIYLPYQISQPPGIKNLFKAIKRKSSVGKRRSSSRSYIDESQPRPRLMSIGSECSSQATTSSKTLSSVNTPTSSRKSKDQLVPLTPVVSSAPEDVPLFSDYPDNESVMSDVSKIASSAPPEVIVPVPPPRKKIKPGSVGTVGSPEDRPEVSSEMTALLAEIKGTIPKRRGYTEDTYERTEV